MQITRLGTQPPTADDLTALNHLKKLIEQAMADGIVTQDEITRIKSTIMDNGANRTADQLWREMELYRKLVTEKAAAGELEVQSLGGWNGAIDVN